MTMHVGPETITVCIQMKTIWISEFKTYPLQTSLQLHKKLYYSLIVFTGEIMKPYFKKII